jgi:16S rRNA pseudouridine516 synthase
MRLVKLIANLGYGSRKQVAAMFREGRITDASGEVLYADDRVEHPVIRIDGEPLDPPQGLVLMLHKPTGYTCSTKDAGNIVYELIPPRFLQRSPVVSTIGRLDRDTSGLLLMTDDGALLHRIVSPKSQIAKIYEATLARDLRGDEVKLFASGKMMLESEREPLAPATLEVIDARHARLTLTEGRYHQARRMFAAVGNHVEALHRSRVGGLELDGLPAGKWRQLDANDAERLFDKSGVTTKKTAKKLD